MHAFALERTDPLWPALPKVMLHEHLDGGLRPDTLLQLCCAKGLAVPFDNAPALANWVSGNANSGSLERYLACFGLTVAAMGSVHACERVALEAVVDAHADGCVLAEFRMAPLLLEAHGVAPQAAVEALLAGLQRGYQTTGMPSGLIVCAMRTDSVQEVERAARLAVTYAGRGVVGFDLAGAEWGFPASLHRSAIQIAQKAGLGITVHAGEADGGERVLEALALGATRIGHGVRIAEGPEAPERMAQVAAMRTPAGQKIHFEVCPSSNVHTGAVSTMAQHPLVAMLAAGLSVSVQTDNRLVSMVTMASEMQLAQEQLGLDRQTLLGMVRLAAQASFLGDAARTRAVKAVDRWCLAEQAKVVSPGS